MKGTLLSRFALPKCAMTNKRRRKNVDRMQLDAGPPAVVLHNQPSTGPVLRGISSLEPMLGVADPVP